MSSTRKSCLIAGLVVALVAGFVGWLPLRSAPLPPTEGEIEGRFAPFPPVATLLQWFEEGRLGTTRPGEDERRELAEVISDLNEMWGVLRTEQHTLLARLARDRIQSGSVEPARSLSRASGLRPADGAIGTHAVMMNGVLSVVDFYPGDSEELDAVTAELTDLGEVGRSTIRSYFR